MYCWILKYCLHAIVPCRESMLAPNNVCQLPCTVSARVCFCVFQQSRPCWVWMWTVSLSYTCSSLRGGQGIAEGWKQEIAKLFTVKMQCVFLYMCMFVCLCVYVCMCVYVCVFVSLWVCMCVCILIWDHLLNFQKREKNSYFLSCLLESAFAFVQRDSFLILWM